MGERLTADTPQTTVAGNTFIAPAGWRVVVSGPATILEPPEAGSRIAIVDVEAKDADAAVALAWAAHGTDKKWPLKLATDAPDRDGWTRVRYYDYQTSPDEKRDVGVSVRFANGMWTAVVYDMDQAVDEKRRGQVGLIFSRLLPKGRERESFAGKPANTLDQARMAAGGAWSSVNDVLKYIQLELAEGKLPDGSQYIAKETLLARRAPQVALSRDATYGMGLVVDKTWGVTVVHHGGDLIGFHSDMMWLPDHGVVAVVLTNGDPGWLLRSAFQRKLLEVLFDGRPEADADIAAKSKMFLESMAAERKLLTAPADAAESAKLAAYYKNAALGEIRVSRVGGATIFGFGEWKSEVGSRRNPDGSVSFLTSAPGISRMEFVVGRGAKRTLTIRDAQHEYVFDEK